MNINKLNHFFIVLTLLVFSLSCTTDSEKAQQYFDKGVEKTALGEYSEAIRHFDRAIKLKPDFAKAYTFRGSVKYDMKDLEGALNDYNRSIELDPYCADPYDYRGTIKMIYLDEAGACEDFKKAEALGKPGMYEKTKFCP